MDVEKEVLRSDERFYMAGVQELERYRMLTEAWQASDNQVMKDLEHQAKDWDLILQAVVNCWRMLEILPSEMGFMALTYSGAHA